MSQAATLSTPLVAPSARRHDSLSMALHWLTLLLVIATFGTIWAREQASDGGTATMLLNFHRSAGALIWVVTLARLARKAMGARSPALPASMARAQRWAARSNEYVLYVLLIAQPITGFIQSIGRGQPFPLLGLAVPAIMARDKSVVHLFHGIHETSATLLLVLVGLHACAALFHGIVLRDGVLSAMLPSQRRLAEEQTSGSGDLVS